MFSNKYNKLYTYGQIYSNNGFSKWFLFVKALIAPSMQGSIAASYNDSVGATRL